MLLLISIYIYIYITIRVLYNLSMTAVLSELVIIYVISDPGSIYSCQSAREKVLYSSPWFNLLKHVINRVLPGNGTCLWPGGGGKDRNTSLCY